MAITTYAPMPLARVVPPPPIKPIKMTDLQQVSLPEAALPKTRRIGEADIDELCRSGAALFKKRFPRLEPERLAYYIRANMNSNDVQLLRTDHAWGCARIIRSFYEPEAVVQIEWVAKITNSLSDPLALYTAFDRWARAIKARELRFGTMTDTSVDVFAKRLNANKKHVEFVKILG